MPERERQISLGEFYAPLLLLLRVDAICDDREVIFQLPQPRDELYGLPLDTFGLLGGYQLRVGTT